MKSSISNYLRLGLILPLAMGSLSACLPEPEDDEHEAQTRYLTAQVPGSYSDILDGFGSINYYTFHANQGETFNLVLTPEYGETTLAVFDNDPGSGYANLLQDSWNPQGAPNVVSVLAPGGTLYVKAEAHNDDTRYNLSIQSNTVTVGDNLGVTQSVNSGTYAYYDFTGVSGTTYTISVSGIANEPLMVLDSFGNQVAGGTGSPQTFTAPSDGQYVIQAFTPYSGTIISVNATVQ